MPGIAILEFSGNYEEVLTDVMMSDHPTYTIRALGIDVFGKKPT